MERKNRDLLPSLRVGTEIAIVSDYAGQNKETYQSLSFVLLHLPGNEEWDKRRANFRTKYIQDGREISYKRMNGDTRMQKALMPFLDAVDSIHGMSITFQLNKQIRSVFVANGSDYLQKRLPKLQIWKRGPFEKLFRVTSFLGFLIAGLSAPGQNILWLSDRDEIMANDEMLAGANKFLGDISDGYLSHRLGSLHCRDERFDCGTCFIKDLVSIADLVAGALTDAANMNSEPITPKALEILKWFARKNQPFKRLVCVIDLPASGSLKELSFAWHNFQQV